MSVRGGDSSEHGAPEPARPFGAWLRLWVQDAQSPRAYQVPLIRIFRCSGVMPLADDNPFHPMWHEVRPFRHIIFRTRGACIVPTLSQELPPPSPSRLVLVEKNKCLHYCIRIPPCLDAISSSPHGYECVLQSCGTAPAQQPVMADISLTTVDRQHLLTTCWFARLCPVRLAPPPRILQWPATNARGRTTTQ